MIIGIPFAFANLPAASLRIRSAPSTSGDASSVASQASGAVHTADAAIVGALGQLSIAPATYSPPKFALSAMAALLNGRIARLGTIHGAQSSLASTQPVNSQSNTARTSTSPLGLDAGTAVSVLRSAGLGLDTTSPAAGSTLASSGVLGLDVTSPAAASLLASAAALGLDLTSPNAASALASARALGLDLTSPETASQLYSRALGLDLTSPNAASKLRSALSLGLDVTSAETASRLSSSGLLGLDVTSATAASRLSSSAALGLDVVSPSAASLLRSAASLGLDLTSPDAASRVTSSRAIGLDVTSPTAASTLASSALGLDLVSPDRASVLRSSSGLLLDVTSPTAPSKVTSAALGLDLTSANAPSVLSSSAALGLDITSAQRASQLDSSASLGLDTTSAETASVLSSSTTLGLDTTSAERASTIVSTGDVNSASTAYAPSVTMSSGTSTATLSGVFTGVNTAASMTGLTIKFMSNTTIGTTAASVHFQVLDQAGTKLLDYSASIKAGDRVYLGDDIGLSVSFSAGTAINGATGTSTVSHSAATVDPTAAFNAAPNSAPRFDNGAQVTSGSFKVNGTSIAVAASDSINSVITKINASAAGVTASFANDRLTLTTNAASEDNIFLASDTSGFLSAMKLTAPQEEINTATTSYGSNTLTFGLGSSVATLSGTYTGVGTFAGATSLTVKILTAVSSLSSTTATTLKFNVLDQGNKTLFSFTGTLKAGDKVAIDNDSGLWISFSAGSTIANDSATTTVSTTTKTDVDSTATFNNANPNLRPRFENGAQVTAGSFTVNGTTVAVSAGDSINSVLSRINSTVAGVSASFANDRITIANNSGSNPVVLANDTSGFLAATKLAAAVTTPGNVRDDLQVLSKTTQFASVTTGSFSINGTAIAVNASTDSVATIVARINAAGAGVSAVYSSAQGRVILTTTGKSEDQIAITGDTSGFAAAAKLVTANTVRGNIRDDQQVLAKTTQFGTVTNGSFTINGAAIAVNAATDTLAAIVSRINTSGAGVTATFDATANKLHLVSTANSEDLIAVGGDTSGFLAAAKLVSANTVRGNIRDDQQVLAKTTQFGSVATGSFTINGTTIAVDTSADTLSTLLARITASAAGVAATYDPTGDRIVLTGKTNGEDPITVASDSTGFLAAGKLATANTVRGHLPEDGVVLSDLARFASVRAGSFVVDGKTIAVSTTDTIRSIVARINASGARVSAAFDAAANTIALTTTYDTEDLVAVGSDTSGFLAAAGISAASTARGNLRDDLQVLSKTTQFAGVASGSFTINGVSIGVDARTDSLSSVIARINAAGAGVTAAYDAPTDKLVLTSTTKDEHLIAVGSDTTGFLAAAHLATQNTERGHVAEDGVPLYDLARFASVTAGSFTVDGRTIAVTSSDTIQSIVSRINGSGARVSASFDAAANAIRLATTYDTEDLMAIGGDTSGFLAAAGIDAAHTARGNLRDDRQVLAKTSQFAAVTSGSLTINGTSIAVDAATDSLSTIVARINASAAGVSAVYDAASDSVALTAKQNGEDLIQLTDPTGLLSALHLATANTVRGHLAEDGVAIGDIGAFSAVTNGSFVVDGRTIAVSTADSVNDIVARINASGARVTARYAADADRLEIATSYDTEDEVPIGGDTSGFLAAAHLAAANTTRGNLPDDAQVLAKTTQFAGVSSGAFTINGATIAVDAATDSVASLIARINASAAGVTASYDATRDRLDLVGTVDSEDAIVVGNDSTGFLAAAHLDTANTVRGNLRDDQQTLAKTTQFGRVSSGSFTINGVSISVDASTDTLASLLGRINASGAGVVAAYDATADAVTLTTTAATEDAIVVGPDDTGFLDAARLATGNTVVGNLRDDQQVLAKTTQFAGVTAGSFTIGGVAISVDAATDTLSTVIDRINAANAGVLASYGATADRVVLAATTDSEDLIDVGSDDSGFLAAAHLASSNTERGHLPEDAVPLIDLAGFASVGRGAFTVDGHAIDVDASVDTIQSLVDRINASGARVVASYDAETDRIHLAATYASEDDVDVGNDTSGFLAAAGIDAASTARGNLRDDRQVLARTSQFGGVTSGSFTINGVAIGIDASTDSFADVVDRINDAGAGVTAAYDPDADALRLTSTTDGESLIAVGDDTTGFLDAAALSSANTVRGHLPEDTVALRDLAAFASVANGQFVIDGKTIAVDVAADSLGTIVDRINASGARVTASYDAPTDRIMLAAQYASEDAVPIGDDTSGFLAAAHLDPANTIVGNLRDDRQVLARTSQFAGVSSGSFTVNGAAIDIDATRDSLADVIARINGASAGVTASYDAAADVLRLASTGDTEDAIAVENDDTGFLAAAKLATGNTVRGNIADDQQVLSKTTQFAAVTSGAFSLDGVAIDVDASTDTVQSLVAKMNAAGAGIAAAYDSALDRIVLTRDDAGADPIALAGDTSGFLAAAGLDSSNTSLGKLPDDQDVLAHAVRFAGVTSGAFLVNGHSISVDPGADTLGDVLARVNAAHAGVAARYDATSDLVTFTPDTAGGTVSLENDSSGLLAALHVELGTVGTHVDASAAFDGVGMASPLFDPGRSVHAGSFSVNGVRVDVADNDSVNSVLAKISASGAGVSATFDAAAQTVKLAARSDGAPAILLGPDSSGFLAAMKLDGSVQSLAGADPISTVDASLSEMPEYASVRAGVLTVNGVQIGIDPATTTLSAVFAQLERVDGVVASLDAASGTVSIANAPHSTPMRITDTSGLLSALGIDVHAAARRRVVKPAPEADPTNATDVAAGVASAASSLDTALSSYGVGGVSAESALRSAADFLASAGARGVSVTGGSAAPRLTVDAAALAESLRANGQTFLGGFSAGGALGTTLSSLFEQLERAAAATAHAPAVQLTDAVKASFLATPSA